MRDDAAWRRLPQPSRLPLQRLKTRLLRERNATKSDYYVILKILHSKVHVV